MCSPFTELHNTHQQQEISPQTLPLIVKLQDLQAAFIGEISLKRAK